mgnify:CR=1 FL=1
MSYNTLIGAKFALSTTLETAKTVTSITNASPPVVNSTAHGYANNDEIVLFNSWDDFNEVVARASAVAANTFTMAGYDTTDTNFYPAASSAGTAQRIAGWTEMGQILQITGSGGEASFEELKPFDRRSGVKIFTGFSGSSLEMVLGWDRSRADQQAIASASRVAGKKAVRFTLPGGVYGYAYGTVSASPLPTFENVLKQRVVFTMAGVFTSF